MQATGAPAAQRRRARWLGLWILIAALALDRVTKVWLLAEMARRMGAPWTITPFFDLVMVWNRGVSFGMFQAGSDGERYVLIAVSLAISAGLGIWLARTQDRLVAASLGLVIGGAVGNVIDRFQWGAVADFFLVHGFGYYFPAFNVADAAITIGVVGLVLDSFRQHPRRARGTQEDKAHE
ncbi:signal peptidase II [Zavarzinia sp. CC-PAN008]|uniref:signal peptidase II n=1 Tax=Zavarzinia sp. CC-PAN008 TaxID=3243332 RepID=UPI003F748F05